MVVFGIECDEPPLVGKLKLKRFTKIKLLGIKFDCTLSKMFFYYEKCLAKIKKVTNNWMYKHLMIFDKITVVKTFVLSKSTYSTPDS